MSSPDWSCAACTFLNAQSRDTCSMCSTPKPAAGDQWSCAACTFLNPNSVEKCIICSTGKPKEELVEVKQAKKEDREIPTIKNRVARLLFNESRADVHFLIGRRGDNEEVERVPAHRAILAARSEVLAKLLFGPWAEASNGDDIVVDDVDPRAFKAMLQAIYTSDVDLDDEIILGALYCAAKYQCAVLLHACNLFVKQQCSVGNACVVFERLPTVLAAQTSALSFIEDRCGEVISTKGWKDLSPEKMEMILQSDRLMIQEAELLQAVLTWAKNKNGGKEDEKAINLVKPLCPYIRFPTLNIEELAGIVSGTNLLSPDQELCAFQFSASRSVVGEEGDNIEPPPEEVRVKHFSIVQFQDRSGRGIDIKFDEGKFDMLQQGIIHWLGTRRGTTPWVNPAEILDAKGALVVPTASSIGSGSPTTITSRGQENGYTQSRVPSYIQVEFKTISVNPTHYQWSNRGAAFGAANAPRTWRFEGSEDGVKWTQLDNRSNDQAMPEQPGLTRSWKITTPSKKFYRFFRFNMTGANGASSQQLNFGNLEIFGTVRL